VISVLIPAYNAGSTIEATLYSILNQTYPDWEAVVVDDGSTDNTVAVVEKVKGLVRQGDKIQVVRLAHGGCAHATHQGILRCRADVVTVVDADDLVYPDALSSIVKAFREDHCYMWTRFVHSSWEQRQRPAMGWTKDLPGGRSLKKTFLETGWWGGSHQRVFRRGTYLEETPHLDQRWQTAVDLQLCLLMAGTGRPTKWLPKVTYWYRRHKPQMSHQRRPEQRQAHREMLREWRERHTPARIGKC
jgi:glycosyltransferase involved in cell wall biosynthesis